MPQATTDVDPQASAPRASGAPIGSASPVTSAPEFRTMMRHFASGVAVVTARDADGSPQGMTCNSLTSVCLEPATLLVCLSNGSRTLAAVRATNGFAVNILNARARRVAQLFSAPVEDRFEHVRWEPSRAGVPLLTEDAAAWTDCEAVSAVEHGDHKIVLGQARTIGVREPSLLLYGMHEYRKWEPTRESE